MPVPSPGDSITNNFERERDEESKHPSKRGTPTRSASSTRVGEPQAEQLLNLSIFGVVRGCFISHSGSQQAKTGNKQEPGSSRIRKSCAIRHVGAIASLPIIVGMFPGPLTSLLRGSPLSSGSVRANASRPLFAFHGNVERQDQVCAGHTERACLKQANGRERKKTLFSPWGRMRVCVCVCARVTQMPRHTRALTGSAVRLDVTRRALRITISGHVSVPLAGVSPTRPVFPLCLARFFSPSISRVTPANVQLTQETRDALRLPRVCLSRTGSRHRRDRARIRAAIPETGSGRYFSVRRRARTATTPIGSRPTWQQRAQRGVARGVVALGHLTSGSVAARRPLLSRIRPFCRARPIKKSNRRLIEERPAARSVSRSPPRRRCRISGRVSDPRRFLLRPLDTVRGMAATCSLRFSTNPTNSTNITFRKDAGARRSVTRPIDGRIKSPAMG